LTEHFDILFVAARHKSILLDFEDLVALPDEPDLHVSNSMEQEVGEDNGLTARLSGNLEQEEILVSVLTAADVDLEMDEGDNCVDDESEESGPSSYDSPTMHAFHNSKVWGSTL
jgi:hypothetical protein